MKTTSKTAVMVTARTRTTTARTRTTTNKQTNHHNLFSLNGHATATTTRTTKLRKISREQRI